MKIKCTWIALCWIPCCSSAVIKCSLPECHCSASGDLHSFSKHLSYNTWFSCCNQGLMAPARALLAVQAASCQVISVTAPACCWQSVPNYCVYTLILIMNSALLGLSRDSAQKAEGAFICFQHCLVCWASLPQGDCQQIQICKNN